MRTINAEVIGVGTELLLGQIANTNAQWISQQLAVLGIHVYHHSVVGDNLERCSQTFQTAHNRSNLVIVTGGLGPTEDDMTRDAAQSIFGQKLVTDEESMERIEHFYVKNNQPMSPNNRKQALVFEHADVLQNLEGMAPGMIVQHESTAWVFLPGVPSEMKFLMNQHVLPFLKDRFQLEAEIASEMLRFIGIGESQLEHDLADIIQSQTNPTIAPLASEGEVGLRLTAKAASSEEAKRLIETAKTRILAVAGEYYYGSDNITIEEKVLKMLQDRGWSIASAESLTGGRFMDRLVSIPGASSVCNGAIVAYSAEVKERVLEVPKFLLKKYGTVSEECASCMVLNVQSMLESDVAVSFTGVAGPDAVEGHEAGTVYIGLQLKDQQPIIRKFHFTGRREQIRNRAVKKALEMIFHQLKK
ncbi:competence/damage-inducible protein A [Thalassobacillus hwangdonensis]|uniref:Putative competence-damage inducible protein n=1 Tax=Thalassobacillus hwangdonensis TaxID=546108 RepID=A0ABW3KX55_9BACI